MKPLSDRAQSAHSLMKLGGYFVVKMHSYATAKKAVPNYQFRFNGARVRGINAGAFKELMARGLLRVAPGSTVRRTVYVLATNGL